MAEEIQPGQLEQALEDMRTPRVIEHVETPEPVESVIYVPPELAGVESPSEIHILPSSYTISTDE